jgi:hypothetical protein
MYKAIVLGSLRKRMIGSDVVHGAPLHFMGGEEKTNKIAATTRGSSGLVDCYGGPGEREGEEGEEWLVAGHGGH